MASARTNTAEESGSRLERRRDAKKQAILRAAGAELAESGFGRASLDDIAERVYITKATLYHYFPNKEALYHAWMDLVSAEVADRVEPIVRSDASARERLAKLAYNEVLLLTTELPDYARIFTGGVDWPDAFQDRIRELRSAHERPFRDVIQSGIESGEFEVEDPAVARYCLQGALVYVLEWYHKDGRLTPEDLAHQVSATVLRLFVKDPG
jgi:AcrR family transcriptional regulator